MPVASQRLHQHHPATFYCTRNKPGTFPSLPDAANNIHVSVSVAHFYHPSPQSRWKNMSQPSISNCTQQQFSLCPTFVHFLAAYLFPLIFFSFSNGRHAVGDGAFTSDNTPRVLAVCHMQGTNDMYYYSTTFSGGPGVCPVVVANRAS